MGKRIVARARGKGGPRYRAPSHRYLGKVEYFPVTGVTGKVKDIVHDPGRSAPVAIIKLENGKEILHIASEGLKTGDTITYDGEPFNGNILSLSKIPVGVRIHGIETYPWSGPKLCRCSGSSAMVVGRMGSKITIQFASGKTKNLDENCRATIGVPAGGGRVEKPFMKASNKYFALRARGKLYPRVRGVVMAPVDHPYGGKSKRPRGKAVPRTAPPGAKIGSISPRRMGKKKGK